MLPTRRLDSPPIRLWVALLFTLASSLLFLAVGCGDNDDDDSDVASDDDTTDDDAGNDDDDTSSDDDTSDDDIDVAMPFPEGFLFGSATAGFQVDMGCPTLPDAQCVDAQSDWYQFVTSPEVIDDSLAHVSGEDPAIYGAGHWELFENDFDLAANELHHNAFRMSIEWSRIFPESTVGVEGYDELSKIADANAVEHYHQVFAALRERGLTPFVTLDHYTMPVWMHDGVGCHIDFKGCTERGWLDKDKAVHEIAKYAGFVAKEFGGEVDLWATLNEPLAVLLPGYLLPTDERSNPPAVLMRFDAFKQVMAAMIEGHARMVDAVRSADDQDADGDDVAEQVGIVYAMAPAVAADPDNPDDQKAAENLFYLWNMAFLNAVALGEFDEDLDGVATYRDDLAGRLDFVGLNFYARVTVEGFSKSALPGLSPLLTFNPVTLAFDEVYPRGIYEMTQIINDQLGVPVIVSENNGRSAPDDDNASEQRYLVEHLSWLWKAIEDGGDVRGYFYWALIDNYEWNQGPRDYGLYSVDIFDPDKPRTAKPIVAEYASIARAGGIPAELAEQYPVEFE
ncbi:MAG: glycoside hydrolase family 1 protein [Deltaproteobacteria bacterium]|nr:glycoside hydrolase family 1 protein [Deltaproteobacteria bacterium]